MRNLLPFAFLALTLTSFLPAAQAGSEGSPELSDETGDTWVYPNPPAAGPAADAVDLVAVWLEEDGKDVRFTMKVVDLGWMAVTESNAVGDARWWVEFGVRDSQGTLTGSERAWRAEVFVSEGTLWSTTFSVSDPEGERTQVDGGYDVAAATLWVRVPKTTLGVEGGGRLTDLFSRTGTYYPAYPVWIGDDGTRQENVSFEVQGEAPEGSGEPAGSAPDKREAPLATWLAAGSVALAALLSRRRSA